LIHKAQLLEGQGARDEAVTLLKTLLDPAFGTVQTMALARLKLATLGARSRWTR